MIAELERRLAAGERSLRGLNSCVLELDQSLLTNVNTPEDLARISEIVVDARPGYSPAR